MDVGSTNIFDPWNDEIWRGKIELNGDCLTRLNDINTCEQSISPWSDGSNLRAVSSDPFYPYGDGCIDVGINQETLEEAIRRVISEEFRKAGIGIDGGRYVATMDLARIEKYKMKHR